MIDYSSFKAEDFLLDDRFIDYCNNRNDNGFRATLEKNHPGIKREIDKALEMFDLISLKASPQEIVEELNKLTAALNSTDITHRQSPVVKSTFNFGRLKNIAVAAIILGIIAAGSIWYNSTFNTQNTAQEYSLNQFNTITTSPFDDRREISLPDGSKVLLNYGSTIKVEDSYNVEARRVFLGFVWYNRFW